MARRDRLMSAGVLLACAVASWLICRRLLEPNVFSDDAFVHQYWMWHFRDAALFDDPLTADLRASGRYPIGYEALFWLPTQIVSPIVFGEWLGVALMALSGWLVYAIVREHGGSAAMACVGAALFIALLDVNRFHGGFQRAFVHPAVLLTVLLAMRDRQRLAAVVAGGTALLYPPAMLLAVGVLILSVRDGRRARWAVAALGLGAAAVLVPMLLAGATDGHVLSRAEARRYPDFGAHGPLHFFVDSTLGYLRQNRSGFDLRVSGSLLLLAAAALLVLRRVRLRREVAVMPVVALGAFTLAQIVLFRLYLPHRYTYPLLSFAAIAIGVALGPVWVAALRTRRPEAPAAALLAAPAVLYLVAGHLFPLGPDRPLGDLHWVRVLAVAVAVTAGAALVVRLPRAATAGALVTGVALVLAVGHAGAGTRGKACPVRAATPVLAALPKAAIVAGDPSELKCVPATTRRAVVISTQIAPSYESGYFLRSRARMFATLRALYGPSRAAITALGPRYGVTQLWVRRQGIRAEMRAPQGVRWRAAKLPFGRVVRGLLRNGPPASLSLPARCARFDNGNEAVYDISCLETDGELVLARDERP